MKCTTHMVLLQLVAWELELRLFNWVLKWFGGNEMQIFTLLCLMIFECESGVNASAFLVFRKCVLFSSLACCCRSRVRYCHMHPLRRSGSRIECRSDKSYGHIRWSSPRGRHTQPRGISHSDCWYTAHLQHHLPLSVSVGITHIRWDHPCEPDRAGNSLGVNTSHIASNFRCHRDIAQVDMICSGMIWKFLSDWSLRYRSYLLYLLNNSDDTWSFTQRLGHIHGHKVPSEARPGDSEYLAIRSR